MGHNFVTHLALDASASLIILISSLALGVSGKTAFPGSKKRTSKGLPSGVSYGGSTILIIAFLVPATDLANPSRIFETLPCSISEMLKPRGTRSEERRVG